MQYARVPNVLQCMFSEATPPPIKIICFAEEKLTSDRAGFSGGRDNVCTVTLPFDLLQNVVLRFVSYRVNLQHSQMKMIWFLVYFKQGGKYEN